MTGFSKTSAKPTITITYNYNYNANQGHEVEQLKTKIQGMEEYIRNLNDELKMLREFIIVKNCIR